MFLNKRYDFKSIDDPNVLNLTFYLLKNILKLTIFNQKKHLKRQSMLCFNKTKFLRSNISKVKRINELKRFLRQLDEAESILFFMFEHPEIQNGKYVVTIYDSDTKMLISLFDQSFKFFPCFISNCKNDECMELFLSLKLSIQLLTNALNEYREN